ncbi:MAG: galactose mutarotase [Opitutaceae bacterium]|nr:galactose mutarotase [Opitutaceae bacterium]
MHRPIASDLETAVYGKMADGREVKIFTLANAQGLVARITEYGATLVSLEVPDRQGVKADVTLGYDTLEGWLRNSACLGVTVGRFANRIARGKFTLDGREYTLALNSESAGVRCHIHGGVRGFDKALWRGRAVRRAGARGVELAYTSRDGEEGYPGTLQAKATYWLTDANELIWAAEAVTDQPTIVNLVSHVYWNLTGDPARSTGDHRLMIAADEYLPTDQGLIPLGRKEPVAGTPMDFRVLTPVRARLGADFEALKLGNGYDHCWVLRDGPGVRLAAVLQDPAGGRTMEVLTDQPGVQFYGGNHLDDSGKGRVKYGPHAGLCLETENFPDAPNHPGFPSAVLRPGEVYRHTMVCRFTR